MGRATKAVFSTVIVADREEHHHVRSYSDITGWRRSHGVAHTDTTVSAVIVVGESQ